MKTEEIKGNRSPFLARMKGGRRMSYLLNVMMGKENFVRTILQKNGISSISLRMKGLLVTDVIPSTDLLDRLPHIYSVIEIPDEAKNLLEEDQSGKEGLRPGLAVEVTGGIYQSFKGIVREVGEGTVKVDLALFGKVVSVELQSSELKPILLEGPWA